MLHWRCIKYPFKDWCNRLSVCNKSDKNGWCFWRGGLHYFVVMETWLTGGILDQNIGEDMRSAGYSFHQAYCTNRKDGRVGIFMHDSLNFQNHFPSQIIWKLSADFWIYSISMLLSVESWCLLTLFLSVVKRCGSLKTSAFIQILKRIQISNICLKYSGHHVQ